MASMGQESPAALEALRWGAPGGGCVYPGAGLGSRQKGCTPEFPSCGAGLQHPAGQNPKLLPWEGRVGVAVPLAFCSVGASPYLVPPCPRLYLSLVLGNVNVTLLSKQAK